MCDELSKGSKRVGGVLGLRYASSQAMRLANRVEGLCHKLQSDVGFLVGDNSPSSFTGRAVLTEKSVTWQTYFMVLEFVM